MNEDNDTLDAVAFSVMLAIGASFVAAGFVAWSLLQVKEITIPIGDWIREANERRRQRIREEGRQQGQIEGLKQALRDRLPQAHEEGRQQGREEMRREMLTQSGDDPNDDAVAESPVPSSDGNGRSAYLAGYEDAQRGRPLASRDDAYVNGYGDAQHGRPLDLPPNGPQADVHQS